MKTNLSKLNTKNLPNFKSIIKKNLDFVILISTALIVILIVQTFNFIKEERKKHLFDILNKVCFRSSLIKLNICINIMTMKAVEIKKTNSGFLLINELNFGIFFIL